MTIAAVSTTALPTNWIAYDAGAWLSMASDEASTQNTATHCRKAVIPQWRIAFSRED